MRSSQRLRQVFSICLASPSEMSKRCARQTRTDLSTSPGRKGETSRLARCILPQVLVVLGKFATPTEPSNLELTRAPSPDRAPRAHDVAPTVSGPWASVIDRGLSYDKRDRYQSAEEMREDVRRALRLVRAPSAPTPSGVPQSRWLRWTTTSNDAATGDGQSDGKSPIHDTPRRWIFRGRLAHATESALPANSRDHSTADRSPQRRWTTMKSRQDEPNCPGRSVVRRSLVWCSE